MIEKITTYLSQWGEWILTKLHILLVSFVQSIIDLFIDLALYVVGLFPADPGLVSPGESPAGAVMDIVFQTVAWLFPIPYIFTLVGTIVASVLLYFVIAPLARWVKLLT